MNRLHITHNQLHFITRSISIQKALRSLHKMADELKKVSTVQSPNIMSTVLISLSRATMSHGIGEAENLVSSLSNLFYL